LIRLTFSRDPKPFHDMMERSMRENGGVRLPGGAYLIVPNIFPDVHSVIRAQVSDQGLRGSSVITTEELEDSIFADIRSLPRRHMIGQQHRQTIAMDVPSTWEDLAQEMEEQEAEVQQKDQSSEGMVPISLEYRRTFIHVQVPSSLFSAPSGGPRTESNRASMILENPRNKVPRKKVLGNVM